MFNVSEQIALISINRINLLVFLLETGCALCAVRTEVIYSYYLEKNSLRRVKSSCKWKTVQNCWAVPRIHTYTTHIDSELGLSSGQYLQRSRVIQQIRHAQTGTAQFHVGTILITAMWSCCIWLGIYNTALASQDKA